MVEKLPITDQRTADYESCICFVRKGGGIKIIIQYERKKNDYKGKMKGNVM